MLIRECSVQPQEVGLTLPHRLLHVQLKLRPALLLFFRNSLLCPTFIGGLAGSRLRRHELLPPVFFPVQLRVLCGQLAQPDDFLLPVTVKPDRLEPDHPRPGRLQIAAGLSEDQQPLAAFDAPMLGEELPDGGHVCQRHPDIQDGEDVGHRLFVLGSGPLEGCQMLRRQHHFRELVDDLPQQHLLLEVSVRRLQHRELFAA